MASPSDAEEGNPYLAARSAKIARNENRLRELGLWKEPRPSSGGAPKAKRSRKPAPSAPRGPVRRSGRLSSQARPDYKDASLPSEVHLSAGRKRPISTTDNDLYADEAPAPVVRRAASAATPKAPAANSVRSIDLDVKKLLLGEGGGSAAGLLGKMVEQTGKEFVVNQSFALAASADDQERLAHAKLSFNKYCGVQEWGNCVFLWVNLGNADSPNDFLDDARQVTWFGGSRMHDESPVIHKLLEYGKEASSAGGSNIVLWCRRHRPEDKSFSPYACFGRLGYRSHVPGSRPLSFVWELLDYDRLKNHADAGVRQTFEEFTG
ncbi:hypothetical protein ACHAXT_009295 [Thalassiosira profunda]